MYIYILIDNINNDNFFYRLFYWWVDGERCGGLIRSGGGLIFGSMIQLWILVDIEWYNDDLICIDRYMQIQKDISRYRIY